MEKIIDALTWIENHRFIAVPINIVLDLLVCYLVYKIGAAILKKVLKPDLKIFKGESKKRVETIQKISIAVLRAILIGFVIIDILSQFIDIKALLTVAGVGTIAIGIGAQAMVGDLISGFMILAENQFFVGDYIEVDETHYGRVEKIGLRTTTIRQLDDSVYIIRNGEIYRLTNYSKGTVRAVVSVGIAFEENMEQVSVVLGEMLALLSREMPQVFLNTPEIMGVDALADSAVMLRIEADVKASDKRAAERILRQRIKEALDANGIEIPYSKHVIVPAATDAEVETAEEPDE